jgi:hypothetical protein
MSFEFDWIFWILFITRSHVLRVERLSIFSFIIFSVVVSTFWAYSLSPSAKSFHVCFHLWLCCECLLLLHPLRGGHSSSVIIKSSESFYTINEIRISRSYEMLLAVQSLHCILSLNNEVFFHCLDASNMTMFLLSSNNYNP